jgi:hypothetical protein
MKKSSTKMRLLKSAPSKVTLKIYSRMVSHQHFLLPYNNFFFSGGPPLPLIFVELTSMEDLMSKP